MGGVATKAKQVILFGSRYIVDAIWPVKILLLINNNTNSCIRVNISDPKSKDNTKQWNNIPIIASSAAEKTMNANRRHQPCRVKVELKSNDSASCDKFELNLFHVFDKAVTLDVKFDVKLHDIGIYSKNKKRLQIDVNGFSFAQEVAQEVTTNNDAEEVKQHAAEELNKRGEAALVLAFNTEKTNAEKAVELFNEALNFFCQAKSLYLKDTYENNHQVVEHKIAGNAYANQAIEVLKGIQEDDKDFSLKFAQARSYCLQANERFTAGAKLNGYSTNFSTNISYVTKICPAFIKNKLKMVSDGIQMNNSAETCGLSNTIHEDAQLLYAQQIALINDID